MCIRAQHQALGLQGFIYCGYFSNSIQMILSRKMSSIHCFYRCKLSVCGLGLPTGQKVIQTAPKLTACNNEYEVKIQVINK